MLTDTNTRAGRTMGSTSTSFMNQQELTDVRGDSRYLADLSEDDLDLEEEKNEDARTYCIINGNGYNVIKNALVALKPGWKEIKKEELWHRMQRPNFTINFIWKPCGFQ